MNKQKIKIAFLDFDDVKNPLLAGGQSVVTSKVGSRLAIMGYCVKVYCSKYPGFKNRVENGIEYIHVGSGSSNIRLNNFIYILLTPFIVRKIKADIIFECFTAPISTLFSPLFTKVPVIAIPTSFEAEHFSKKYHLPFHIIERFGIRFYKYAVTSSNDYTEKIKKLNPNIISKQITHGVEDSFFRIKQGKVKHMLYLGRIDIHQKGIDLLIRAYSKVADKVNYPLIIIGNGPDEAKVRKLIEKYSLQDKVKLVGPKYGKEKEKYFSEAVCFMVPSRQEGFCIAALESLASGVPVVSFDIAGLSWMSRQVSFKARLFNMQRYSQLLLKASRVGTVKSLKNKCRKFSRKYSWDHVSKKYDQFIKEVLIREGSNKLLVNNIKHDKKIFNVSVGISALNEEKNIEKVIKSVLGQKESGWKLKEILIHSDGSTDKTAEKVSNIKDRKIRLYVHKKRKGKTVRLNNIFKQFTGDILLFIDADIMIKNKCLITNIVNEFRLSDKVMLVNGNVIATPPKGFFQNAIYTSYKVYYRSRKELGNGHNIWSCAGACMALRKSFAKSQKIPQKIRSEDVYLYLNCIKNKHVFRLASDSKVYFKLANNLTDFLKQTFRTSPESIGQVYKDEYKIILKKELKRPKLFYFTTIVQVFVENPLGTVYMILLRLICKPLYPFFSAKYKLSWFTAESTK